MLSSFDQASPFLWSSPTLLAWANMEVYFFRGPSKNQNLCLVYPRRKYTGQMGVVLWLPNVLGWFTGRKERHFGETWIRWFPLEFTGSFCACCFCFLSFFWFLLGSPSSSFAWWPQSRCQLQISGAVFSAAWGVCCGEQADRLGLLTP